ncbi:MAG TPA: DUF1015 domain-containing protein [Rectinemataceae bacterium]
MANALKRLEALGVSVPEILLPAKGVDLQAWSVVACDQYSSEREYWEGVARRVGDKPSTLKLIFPECYLEDGDKAARIRAIQRTMEEYLESDLLVSQGQCLVLVERTTPYEATPRLGIVLALDLEKYAYGSGSKSLVRPTEGTIVERLPPRMEIRRSAPLELPHIMVLIDDPRRRAIEPIYEKRAYLPKLYDFELQGGAGRLRGWKVDGEAHLSALADALESLADPFAFKAAYGSEEILLFAVGDGNHSLATAKAIWEEIKSANRGQDDLAALMESHPARYALVELLNVYDEGLPFHPIHRILLNVDEAEVLAAFEAAGASISRQPRAASAFAACDAAAEPGSGWPGHTAAYLGPSGCGLLTFPEPGSPLAAGSFQAVLDAFLSTHPASSIDYIHGSGSLEALSMKRGSMGLYLPPVDKGSFFRTVIEKGVMPRKTFSMGEAPEKRFYLEARRIRPRE